MKNQPLGKRRRIAGLAFFIAGLGLVVAAVLLLLFADLPPAVAAGMGVPGLALIATGGRTIADLRG